MTNSEGTLSEPLSEPASSPSVSPMARGAMALIRAYQRLTSGRPSPCRFYPSCSNYALEALEVHGVLHGTALAARRIGKCQPLGPHGIDLVPPPRASRRKGRD